MEQFINNPFFQFTSLPQALYFVFYIVLAATAAITLVLYYHWVRYSVGILSALGAFILYSLGTATLLASMFLSVRGLL